MVLMILLEPASDVHESPTSLGHVHNHSVRTINPDRAHDVDLLGSSAEIVNERDGDNDPIYGLAL